MSVKVLLRWFVIPVVAGFIALLTLGTVQVQAQCEVPNRSTCSTCHESEDPINDKGEWHVIHANKDLCINCHGGNGSAQGANLAHEAMTSHPLEDIYTDCHGCHPDYDARAQRFAQTLGVQPGSCPTPTPVQMSAPCEPPCDHSIYLPDDKLPAREFWESFMKMGAMLAVMAFFLLLLRLAGQHQVKS